MTAVENRKTLIIRPWKENKTMSELIYGTCYGQTLITKDKVIVNCIINTKPHNGDFKGWLRAVELYCLDEKDLYIINFLNPNLYAHLLRRGYHKLQDPVVIGEENVSNGCYLLKNELRR